MFPELRSGVMRMLARPATGEFGIFLVATVGLMAASSCISPSMSQSGWFLRIWSRQKWYFSRSGFLPPEPLVE